MFVAGKAAAPLAAGNALIMKPPEQAPLSALRLAELVDGLLPPGVFNVRARRQRGRLGARRHPDVAMVALIGSVPTGRAVMRAAAETVKPVLLELGGKNALIAFPTPIRTRSQPPSSRHELHLVRPVLRLDQPRVHPRGDLRRRAGPGAGANRALQAGPADRSRDHHGRDRLPPQYERVLGYIDAAQPRRCPARQRRRPARAIRRSPAVSSSSRPCSPMSPPT